MALGTFAALALADDVAGVLRHFGLDSSTLRVSYADVAPPAVPGPMRLASTLDSKLNLSSASAPEGEPSGDNITPELNPN